MWKKHTAVAENVYIADTPSFVTEKQEKIVIDYGEYRVICILD